MKVRAPTTAGIYAIRNCLTGALYIGSAGNFRRRWYEHRSYLQKGTHANRWLQEAWTADGEDAFAFEVLEAVTVPALVNEAERQWTRYYTGLGVTLYSGDDAEPLWLRYQSAIVGPWKSPSGQPTRSEQLAIDWFKRHHAQATPAPALSVESTALLEDET